MSDRDNITLPREVVEEAVEALQYMTMTAEHCVDNEIPESAIAALRTALAAEQPKPSSNFDNQGAVLLLRSKSAEIERLKADSEALRRENKRLRTASEKLFRKWSNAAPYHQWEPEMFEMEFALYPPNEGDKR